MTKYCKTCALCNLGALQCQLFGHQIQPTEDYCSKHVVNISQCELCGSPITSELSSIVVTGEKTYYVCNRCASLFGTCKLCKHGHTCAFETDPSSLPKMVEKRVQKGNMIAVTQIKNPERIEATCKIKCPCYDPENECLKQFGACGKCEDI